MGEIKKSYYKSNDPSLTVAERKCIYPINAFLEKNMKAGGKRREKNLLNSPVLQAQTPT